MIFLKRRALMTRASFNYKTVSGIGSITLENCVETRFKRLELLGNSAQGENPSIESPKEIKNSGKYDETSGKYLVDVNVTGKNLFDISKYNQYDDTWTNTAYATKILKLKPNTTYTMSCKRLVDKPNQYVIFNIVSGIKVGKGVTIQIKPDLSLNYFYGKGTFTTDETGEIKFNYYVDCSKEKYWFTEVIGDIQIELGSTQTAYDAYKEPQTIQIALDEPLRGIGEYKDVITKDGIVRNILQVRIADYLQNTIYGESGKKYLMVSPPNALMKYDRKRCMSNVGFTKNGEDILYIPVVYESNIKLNVSDDDTVETIREKVKDVVVAYTVKEPILEALPTELELALSNLYTNDGSTIISVDSGEVETGIEVEYAIKN